MADYRYRDVHTISGDRAPDTDYRLSSIEVGLHHVPVLIGYMDDEDYPHDVEVVIPLTSVAHALRRRA